MPSQLQVFLLPANFKLDRMTSHKHCLAAITVQNGSLRSCVFRDQLRHMAGTSGAETWESGKGECLLAIGKDKKVSFLE